MDWEWGVFPILYEGETNRTLRWIPKYMKYRSIVLFTAPTALVIDFFFFTF